MKRADCRVVVRSRSPLATALLRWHRNGAMYCSFVVVDVVRLRLRLLRLPLIRLDGSIFGCLPVKGVFALCSCLRERRKSKSSISLSPSTVFRHGVSSYFRRASWRLLFAFTLLVEAEADAVVLVAPLPESVRTLSALVLWKIEIGDTVNSSPLTAHCGCRWKERERWSK